MSEGTPYRKQWGTVWLTQYNSLKPFEWGGPCMRIEDQNIDEGGMSVTTKQNPRGGLERDSVILGPPGASTTSVVMKRTQGSRMKTVLRKCLWYIDMRMHCGGIDLDAPNKWEEITRLAGANVDTRTLSGTNFEGDDEEQMVTLPMTAFDTHDIYRVNGEEENSVASIDLKINDIAVAQPERCPDGCDAQEDCVVYALAAFATGVSVPNLLVNLYGGESGQWTAVPLGVFDNATFLEDADSLIGLGDFVVVSSNDASSIMYSDDRGVTQVEVALASAPAVSPHALAAIDQTLILVGCDGGDIFMSTDSARNWEQIANGLDSGNSIDIVKIARDNPQVIFAASASSANIYKSENGGDTFFLVGATGGGNTTSMSIISQNYIIVGTDAGEVFESVDGGENWVEQNELPGMTAKANVTVTDIVNCGDPGVMYATTFETAVGSKVYRNVDGGADGRWFVPSNGATSAAATTEWVAAAFCDENRLVAAGGAAAVSSVSLLA